MLGSRYSMKQSTAETRIDSEISTVDDAAPVSHSFSVATPASNGIRRRIPVKRDDPIPTQIETQIFDVQGLLKNVMNKR